MPDVVGTEPAVRCGPPGRCGQKTDRGNELKKKLLFAVAVAAGLLVASFLVYRLLEGGRASPVALLVLAALISVSLPILRANLFPSARECAVEFDFHEKRLDEQVRRQIAEAFGQDALEQVYTPTGQFADAAEHRLHRMLENRKTRKDALLRFALHLTLARVFEQNGDTRTSIEQLTRALESHPHHFVANFRLALQHEQVGKAGEALIHYRQALQDPGGISRGMKRFAVAQIKRLTAAAS